MEQPTPEVNRNDVVRIIRRDFASAPEAEVLAILDQYGTESWHRDEDRVHLAVLKLADGNLDRVRDHTRVACRDYRDVLAPAEYAAYLHLEPAGLQEDGKRNRAITEDWHQYQQWLTRE